jgi:hypothetical protein
LIRNPGEWTGDDHRGQDGADKKGAFHFRYSFFWTTINSFLLYFLPRAVRGKNDSVQNAKTADSYPRGQSRD